MSPSNSKANSGKGQAKKTAAKKTTTRRVGPPAGFLQRANNAGKAAAQQSFISSAKPPELLAVTEQAESSTDQEGGRAESPPLQTGHPEESVPQPPHDEPGQVPPLSGTGTQSSLKGELPVSPVPNIEAERPLSVGEQPDTPRAAASSANSAERQGSSSETTPSEGPVSSDKPAEAQVGATNPVSEAPSDHDVSKPDAETPPGNALAALPAPPAPSAPLPVRASGRVLSRTLDSLGTVNPRRHEELRDRPPAYEQLLQAYAAAKLKRIKSVGRAIRLHPRIRDQINKQLGADAQTLPQWKLAASHYVDAGLHALTTVDVESEEVLGQLLTAAFQFEEQTFGDDQGESTRYTLRPLTNQAIDKVKYALIANGQDGMLNHVCSVLVWQYLLSLRATSGAS